MANNLAQRSSSPDENRHWQQRKIEAKTSRLMERIEELCFRASRAQATESQSLFYLQRNEEAHPDFAYANIQKTINFLLILLIPLCVYFLNLVLIYEPANYLAGRFLGRDSWMTHVATFSITGVLLLFELGLASLDAHAQDEGDDGHFWRFACRAIVWVTPTLVLASHLAKFTTEGKLPEPHEFLIMLTLIGLALLTDVVVVSGSHAISEALGFFWYHLRQSNNSWQSERSHKEFCKCAAAAAKQLRRCYRLRANFESRFPDVALNLPPFSERTRRVLNDWAEYSAQDNQR